MSDDEAPKDAQLPAKEIAKVANNFLNKISKGAGILYAPTHTKRMARADAKAKIIAANAEQEVTDIALRAQARRQYEEIRHQENIESVVRAAIPDLRPNAKPEDMDDDWMSNFFDYAKNVSDDEMQSLWAKILAGEANTPGSFRKRVLQSVALLDKDEAQLFARVCHFCVYIGGLTPLIFNIDAEIYAAEDLTFTNLTHLDSVGLISFNSVLGFLREPIPSKMVIAYGPSRYTVEMPQGKTQIPVGKVLLTQIGQQLLPLCRAQTVSGFDAYFTAQWKKEGIVVTPKL